MSASVVPAVRRQRAPTITIDTSPVEAPTGVYFDNPGSEAVEATTYELPRQSSGVVTDRGTGSPDLAPDNPFASTPSQLSKMFNPKSLPAFWKLGGLAGTEKGLRTDCHSGLSIDETSLSKSASFDGPSGRPCGGRLNEAPVPSPDSEARQYCYSGRDNASADSETLDEDWNMIVERLDPVTMRRQENLVAEVKEIYARLIDRADKAPAPAPDSEPSQYCYSGKDNASANSETLDKDWTKIANLAERRRIQNRIAQRNYRKKLKRRLEELEQRAANVDGYLSTGDAERGGNHSTKPGETTRADWVGGPVSWDFVFPQGYAAWSKTGPFQCTWYNPCPDRIFISSRSTAESLASSGSELDGISWGKDAGKGKVEFPSGWGLDPLRMVTEMRTKKMMESVKAHLANHHHRQPQPTWGQVGAFDVSGGMEGHPNLSRPHTDTPSWLGLPSSWLLSLGTALQTTFRHILAGSRTRGHPLPASHTTLIPLLLFLLAAPPVSAQHHIPPALLHIAAGTSFATSATIPPLRGSSTVPAPWWITMYVAWGAAFTLFLVAELLRRPSWAQRRLLVGLLLFSGLNLTGSLVQGESMLEGVASWGPLAMTASLWLVPVLMEFWGVRGAGEMMGL